MNITLELAKILEFVFIALSHILPFSLISVLIAASVNQFNFTQRLSDIFRKKIFSAILIATLIGAISPLCACGVIPTIFALINVGIPLAPIMSFWITSPIMSPEAFMITWGNLGLELAIVRLVATIIMGVVSRYITLKVFPLEIPSQSWLKLKQEKKEECCGCNPSINELDKILPQKHSRLKTFFIDVKKLSIFLGGWLLLAFSLLMCYINGT